MKNRFGIQYLLTCTLLAAWGMLWSQQGTSLAKSENPTLSLPNTTRGPSLDEQAQIPAATVAVTASSSKAEQTVAKRAFLSKYSYSTGQENWCLAAGDFNRDGRIDLVTASKGSDQMRVLYNDGTGEFASSRSFATLMQTRALCALDANKDGWMDIASITMIGELSILLNDKKGGFFLPKVIETDRMLQNITSADLNRDGAPDIILAAVSENSLIVYYNDGFGFFSGEGVRIPTGSKPRAIRTADFNRDGRTDIVVGCDDGFLYLHLNAAKTPFQTYSTLRSCSDNWGIAIADLNHDGRPDIVSASYSERQLCVHINKQDTSFHRSQCIASGLHNFDLVADDFNLDGTIDVITCSANDQSVNFHPSNATTGMLEDRISILSGGWNSSMVAADFDSDGDLDIATASILDKAVNVHRNISSEIVGSSKPARIGMEGSIINADVKSPVPFQPVTLIDRKGNVVATAISNYEGHYRLYAEPGNYTVQIRHSNLPLFKVSVALGDTILKQDFQLSRNAGATVQGRVLHRVSDEPIANVLLEIRDGNDSLIGKFYTDPRGNYRSFVPMGLQYKIITHHPDYKTIEKGFDITEADAGDAVDMDIEVEPNFMAVSVYGSANDFLFTTPLPSVSLVFQDIVSGRDIASVTTSDEGSYNILLPVGHYRVFATKKGYYYNATAFELSVPQVNIGSRIDVSLPPMRAGTAILLEEISYQKSEYSVSNVPKESLRSLLRMMLDNPTLVAEIEAHTDNSGSPQANMDLSQRRAEAIVKYLIENGVPSKRIRARGYGDTTPIAGNDTEEGRRQNRRIVFKIVAY